MEAVISKSRCESLHFHSLDASPWNYYNNSESQTPSYHHAIQKVLDQDLIHLN